VIKANAFQGEITRGAVRAEGLQKKSRKQGERLSKLSRGGGDVRRRERTRRGEDETRESGAGEQREIRVRTEACEDE
jgi:hypothetical protein